MIFFLSLEVKNFLSFKSAKLNLASGGLCFVKGVNLDDPEADSNDAGKSNSLNAITWCLYERLAKLGDRRVGDEVVNKLSSKDCAVRLAWEEGKKKYEVLRFRKHEKYGDKVFLLSSEFKSKGKRQATNEEIESALGMSYQMFLRSVFWAQSTSLRRLTQLTDAEYKMLFDELIGTEHYIEKHKKLSDKLSALAIDTDKLQNQSLVLVTTLTAKKEELAGCVDYNVDTNKLHSLASKLNAIDDKIIRSEKQILLLQRKRDELVSSAKIQDSYKTSFITELKKISEGTDSGICSVCKQPLSSRESKQNIEFHKMELEKKIKEFESNSAEIQKELKQVVIKLSREKNHSSKLEEELLKAQGKIWDSVPESLRVRSHNIIESLLAILAENKKSVERKAELTKEINGLEKTLNKAAQTISELESKGYDFRILRQAYSPQGIKTLQLSELSIPLNEYAKEYSEAITGGTVKLEFSTTTQLKSGEIRERYRIDASKDPDVDFSFSGGGMLRKADLIAAFAVEKLRQQLTGKEVNLRVFDEATDGLDASGEQAVVQMLRENLDNQTVFFVSHKLSVSEVLFDRTITVVRENGVSRLEEYE